MHFEILVEDQSGKKFLDTVVPKIIGEGHTFSTYSYKGIGHIPKNLAPAGDPKKRILLDQLPRILRGFGNTHANYPIDCPAAVVVVCDLDDRCLKKFRAELLALLDSCDPKPETRFCIAIEEGEAWLLGDLAAVRSAYPRAKEAVLAGYQNDSICGTWERLADALFPGGSSALKRRGWQAVGAEKSVWAERIAPIMCVDENNSPSFAHFRDKLRDLQRDNGDRG